MLQFRLGGLKEFSCIYSSSIILCNGKGKVRIWQLSIGFRTIYWRVDFEADVEILSG